MKNFAELDAKICSCTDALTAKLDGTNGKRAILLCGENHSKSFSIRFACY